MGACGDSLFRGQVCFRCVGKGETLVEQSELLKLQKYLRDLFRLDIIEVVPQSIKDDSAEVMVGEEFIGVIYRDEEDGEISYQFQMAILEIDLPATN